jgi:hypothetical protein
MEPDSGTHVRQCKRHKRVLLVPTLEDLRSWSEQRKSTAGGGEPPLRCPAGHALKSGWRVVVAPANGDQS